MLGNKFFHDTVRKYVAVFGTLFNDLTLYRVNRFGETIEEIEVPLSYGPRDKFIARLKDENLDRPIALQLPRIGYELSRMDYDPNRKGASTLKIVDKTQPATAKVLYEPVPYTFFFSVQIMTATHEDGVRLVEQILPFFKPDFTPKIKLISQPEVIRDIPITLQSVTVQEIYQGNFEERRAVMHDLSFRMQGFLFGPVRDVPLILEANTNFYVSGFSANTYGTEAYEYVSVVPGQDANGNPTTNTSIAVAANTIVPNSNYGYIVTTTRIE